MVNRVALIVLFLVLLNPFVGLLLCQSQKLFSGNNFAHLSESQSSSNFTCDEIMRWLGTEKHYSNDKKDILFNFYRIGHQCKNSVRSVPQEPAVLLAAVNFGIDPSKGGENKKTFFLSKPGSPGPQKCIEHDEYAVAYLSNFSINNNFSHFLHSLLRLFCALIDSGFIEWDSSTQSFVHRVKYSIWLDEFFRLTKEKEGWLRSFYPAGKATFRSLAAVKNGQCVSSAKILYGSGCVRLLPPEKWFGYPGCRANEMLPAFGHYMRQTHMALGAEELKLVDEDIQSTTDPGLRVAFAVRDVGKTTGMRVISNLQQVQMLIKKTQHVRSSMQNITFEHLDVPSTVRYMAQVHIFVSVHGAGMTNMFFMNPGSAVVEIIPYPLCNCRSPDYFYGTGGYYHGSAIAQGIRHYHYCVPATEVKWHRKPEDIRSGSRCSWKYLHAVESVYIDPSRFVSLMRNVERDLVAAGTILLTRPIINANPHVNG